MLHPQPNVKLETVKGVVRRLATVLQPMDLFGIGKGSMPVELTALWLCLTGLAGLQAAAADQSATATSAAAHWAFRPPAAHPLPAVRDQAWAQTPVDYFVLARLEAKDLQPAPPADPRTLIRRATYDLIGLPPTAAEVESFAADSSRESFAKVVERLLASPRYGERWGRYWLDLARYADTKGYVYYYEESRFVQPHNYRDWVIQAFNNDLPYDQFLLLQIAADQLVPNHKEAAAGAGVSTLRWPAPVYDPSVAALGFLTLGRRFLGLAPDIIDDQIDVLMRGTQALTVGCARCHDHKFDPIPTRDYYSLYGVFQSSEERVVALQPPPAPQQWMEFSRAKAYVAFEQGLTERVLKLEAKYKSACDEVAHRLRARVADYLAAVLEIAKLPSDANVRPQPEDINPFNVRAWERYLATHAEPLFGPWHAFARLPAEQFQEQAKLLVQQWTFQPPATVNPFVARLFTNAPASMEEVARRYGGLLTWIHQQWQSNLAAGAQAKRSVDRLEDPSAEVLRQVLYGPDSPVLPPAGLVTELDVHLYFDDPNRVALANLQTEVERWLITHESEARHAVIMEDRPQPSVPVVFGRGDPLKPGEKVPRQFLEVLAGKGRRPFQHGSGRLELARAIANRNNPLTARVMVNRVWAHHFGVGLVRTPSDFGTRSEPPSHPELLDWLALRFMAEGWSVKNLHRQIMLSNAYRQSSSATPADEARAAEADPENHLLHRFNRQRLDFEALRDSFLAASGDLDLRMGGPATDFGPKPLSTRRAVYGRIDRKFIPGMVRSFDFANPDVHTPERHVTAAPQQALFLLNDPFVADRCRVLVDQLRSVPETDVAGRIQQLYRIVLQRVPTASQTAQAREFLREAAGDSTGTAGAGSAGEKLLSPWEQLAQVLFFSNDFLFVD